MIRWSSNLNFSVWSLYNKADVISLLTTLFHKTATLKKKLTVAQCKISTFCEASYLLQKLCQINLSFISIISTARTTWYICQYTPKAFSVKALYLSDSDFMVHVNLEKKSKTKTITNYFPPKQKPREMHILFQLVHSSPQVWALCSV